MLKPNSICNHADMVKFFERMLAVAEDVMSKFSDDMLGDHPVATLEWADITFQRAAEKRFAMSALNILRDADRHDADDMAHDFLDNNIQQVILDASHVTRSTSQCMNLMRIADLEVRAQFVRYFTTTS